MAVELKPRAVVPSRKVKSLLKSPSASFEANLQGFKNRSPLCLPPQLPTPIKHGQKTDLMAFTYVHAPHPGRLKNETKNM